jgi:hypothetical protein
MKWRKVSGVVGPNYFSEDGQWTILRRADLAVGCRRMF